MPHMVYTNEDLAVGLARAGKRYGPETYTPTEAEQEYGVGADPVVRLTITEAVIALCRVDADGSILCDVLRAASGDAGLPYDRTKQVREELLPGEDLPRLGRLVSNIEQAAAEF